MLKRRISTYSSDAHGIPLKPSKRLSKAVGIVFVSLLLSLGMQSAAFAVLEAINQAQQVEKSFRATYPFHLQVIASTSPLKDQSRVLIISEPPPHISPAYFQDIVNANGGQAVFTTNPIGYDGWVKDAVLALPPLSEDKLARLLTRLHRDLYGTSYKANVVQLPIAPPPPNNRSLDLSVSVGDLNNWLNNSNLKFTPNIGGNPRPLSDVLSSGQSGVFISDQRGLVVWSIPRNQDLAEYRAEARQFFLDSDLIVGAIANNRQLAIVARERTEPLLRLPPLRFETALTLAAEKSNELAQSYEGFQLFAGKLPGQNDWAPIYLSNSLINTEFGSLLNITDQVIKSWSMNGAVEYFNFEKYPQPLKWAPFPRPINDLIKEEKVNFIIFNWNTTGAGYTTSINSYDLYALNRSGALPITYLFNDESAQNYETIGYDYFSGLGNPDLARAVQYTSLYQIFRKFGINTKNSIIQGSLLPGEKVLFSEAVRLLTRLQTSSVDELTNCFQMQVNKGKINSQDANNFRQWILEHKQKELINQGNTQKKVIDDLAAVITSEPMTHPEIKWFSNNCFEIDKVKDRYVESLSQDSSTWMKTPSIILSKQTVSASGVGGHNLDSQLTHLNTSSNVPLGTIKIVDEGVNKVLLYNPKDIGKIQPLSRKFEVGQKTGTPDAILENDLSRSLTETSDKPRSLEQALSLPPESPSTGRGYESLSGNSSVGWSLRGKPLTPDEAQRLLAVDQLAPRSIIIERSPNGFAILRSGNNQVIEAPTIPIFYDEILPQFINSIPDGESPITIYLNGFTSDEAQALTLTGPLRQKAQQISFNSKFSDNVESLSRSYNWNGAVIKEVKIDPSLIGTTSDYKGTIEMEIPSVTPDSPSFKMKIVTSFKALSKAVMDRIAAIVQRVLNRRTPQPRTVNQIVRDIQTELKIEFPDIDLDVQIEAGDIYITQPVKADHLARR